MYFAKQNNQWRLENGTRNPNYVISESETLFGFHPMYSGGMVIQLIDAAISFFCAVTSIASPAVSAIVSTAMDVIKIGILLYVSESIDTANSLKSKLNDLASDASASIEEIKTIKNSIEKLDIAWVMSLVDVFESLYDLIEVANNCVEINFNLQTITCCAKNNNYEVRMKSKNKKIYTLRNYL